MFLFVCLSGGPLRRVSRYTPSQSDFERVFCILSDETKIFKKSTIQKVLRTIILHINNSQKLLTNV